jgi:serine O-acetyltransferase
MAAASREGIKKTVFWIWFIVNALRLAPASLLWRLSRQRTLINADVARWNKELLLDSRPAWFSWVRLMGNYPEFRSLFYHRLGWQGRVVAVLCRPEATLHICTADIGPGLFFQHGFATIVAAGRIGADCWINQQVTIGYQGALRPVIGDRVKIAAGAKVIGGVTLGNDVTVGANAVVVKDVPDGCTVVGVPARIVKCYGKKVATDGASGAPQPSENPSSDGDDRT